MNSRHAGLHPVRKRNRSQTCGQQGGASHTETEHYQ